MQPTIFHRPLRKIDPALEHVLRDPAKALSTEPLVISDRLLGWLLLLMVAAVMISLIPDPNIELIILRIAYVVLALTLPFVATFRKRQVVFDAHGVEYAYGRRSVFLPWSVVDRSASCVTHDNRLKLPVLASAIDTIEHRRDGVAVAYGTGPSSQWLKITADGLVVMKPPFGTAPQELGELILRVARSLPAVGRAVPARSAAAPETVVCRRLPDGSLEVRQTHLDFPPVCCECETPTDGRLALEFRDVIGALCRIPVLHVLAPMAQSHNASMPYCPGCQVRCRYRGWRHAATVAALLALPGWGACLFLWLDGIAAPPGVTLLATLWLLFCAACGASVRARPAVQGRLLPKRAVVRLHFLRPAYADRLHEWLLWRWADRDLPRFTAPPPPSACGTRSARGRPGP
jgi:hypothetical protein